VENQKKSNNHLKHWEAPLDRTVEDAYQEHLHRRASKGKTISFGWRPLMVSVASAAAVILAVIMVWPDKPLIQQMAAFGETKVVVLPDGSKVTLSPGSEVQYASDFQDERTIEMEGMCYFDVIPGSRFSVVTAMGVVDVLGTTFDVLQRDTLLNVGCYTGKVRVTSGNQKVELLPGSSAHKEGKQLIVQEMQSETPSWTDGLLLFEDVPASMVIDELERQFGVTIQADEAFKRKKYTGSFRNDNLEDALQSVLLPLGATHVIHGKTIEVRP
jgi:transmembrane sensor